MILICSTSIRIVKERFLSNDNLACWSKEGHGGGILLLNADGQPQPAATASAKYVFVKNIHQRKYRYRFPLMLIFFSYDNLLHDPSWFLWHLTMTIVFNNSYLREGFKPDFSRVWEFPHFSCLVFRSPPT